MTVTIVADALDRTAAYFDLVPALARRSAWLAINDVVRRKALPDARALMEQQVAFPKGYLNDPKRFGVRKFATEDDLEAAVVGRQRPTSLARFSIGGRPAVPGVRVRVNPGASRAMNRAFLIRLRAGSGPVTDDSFNLGLAVRLKPEEVVQNKKVMVPLGPGGLYLLYGPSVDQLFRTVAGDISPAVADEVATQFFRQFARLSEGSL
jgi:hypothetical protein